MKDSLKKYISTRRKKSYGLYLPENPFPLLGMKHSLKNTFPLYGKTASSGKKLKMVSTSRMVSTLHFKTLHISWSISLQFLFLFIIWFFALNSIFLLQISSSITYTYFFSVRVKSMQNTKNEKNSWLEILLHLKKYRFLIGKLRSNVKPWCQISRNLWLWQLD